MSSFADSTAVAYDGLYAEDLARAVEAPRLVLLDTVGSTLDVAHALAAEGAPAGTLIVADMQTAGRGRLGRTWQSESGAGVWLTVIERPTDASALDVLALRIGIALAPALDRFANERVRLKWPNDLHVAGRKLGGILVEARWRDGAPEWIAIGVGINVRAPRSDETLGRAGLQGGTQRVAVLAAAVPSIRAAASRTGPLTAEELHAFAERDLAAGRECVEPVVGRVRGVDASGALLVEVGSGLSVVRSGSLVLKEDE